LDSKRCLFFSLCSPLPLYLAFDICSGRLPSSNTGDGTPGAFFFYLFGSENGVVGFATWPWIISHFQSTFGYCRIVFFGLVEYCGLPFLFSIPRLRTTAS
jgi:hypothetical protein